MTGTARDVDVFLAELGGYERRMDTPDSLSLQTIGEHLEEKRSALGYDLERFLASGRYRSLRRDWTVFVSGEWSDLKPGRDGDLPVVEFASRRIARSWAKARRLGRGAQEADPRPELLHRVRIACKKLRYLLEFFESLGSVEATGRAIESLKRLQDHLGAHNDRVVHRQLLNQILASRATEAEAGLEEACSRLRRSLFLWEERERRRGVQLVTEFFAAADGEGIFR